MSKENPAADNERYGLPAEVGTMTLDEMKKLAQRIGVLAMERKELDRELNCLKYNLKAEILQKIPETITKSGSVQRILENVGGFTCKVYERTQLVANQKKAREILHPNSFNAIFKPSTSTIVDIRPESSLKGMLATEVMNLLGKL